MAIPKLAMIPSGYKDGKVYSVLPNNGDGDFTFSRGSNATRVNKDGLIETMPLGLGSELVTDGDFEQVGEELITNGGFDTDSDWAKTGGWSFSGGKASESGVSGILYQDLSGITTGDVLKITYEITDYTSGEVRVGVGSGLAQPSGTYRSAVGIYTEYLIKTNSDIAIGFSSNSFIGSIDNVSVKEVGQNWTLGTGWTISGGKAVSNSSVGYQSLSQSTAISNPNGKTFKCNFTISNYSSGLVALYISGFINNSYFIGANGDYEIYVTVSQGTSGNVEFLTNSTGFIGSIDNVSIKEVISGYDTPRLDYSDSSCPSLLLEPQSSNLIEYSESLSNFVKSNITEVSGNQVTPDGTLGSIKITPTSSSLTQIQKTSLTIGSAYSISFFVKKDEVSHLIINQAGSGATKVSYDIDNLTYVGIAGVNANIVSYGNGWARIEYSVNSITYDHIRIILSNGTDVYPYNPPVGDGLYLWGFQLEELSYATSYIPTNGAAATRLADVCNSAGTSDTFNDSEGVLMVECSTIADADDVNESYCISINDGGTTNRVELLWFSDGKLYTQVGNSGQEFISSDTFNNKILIKYGSGSYDLYVNGFRLITDTYTSLSSLDSLDFKRQGNFNFYGNTKQIQYFDSALTDTELEELTSWESFILMANGQNYTIK